MRRCCMKKSIMSMLRNYEWLVLGVGFSLIGVTVFAQGEKTVKKGALLNETPEEKKNRLNEKAALRLSQAAKLKIKAEKISGSNSSSSSSAAQGEGRSLEKKEVVESKKVQELKIQDSSDSSIPSKKQLFSEVSAARVDKKSDDNDVDVQMTEKDVKLPAWRPAAQDATLKSGNWVRISAQDIKVKQLSVGSRDHIWAVSNDNKIYQKDGKSWKMREKGIAVAAAHDGTVYVVHEDNSVAQLVNDQWKLVDGLKLSSITVGNKNTVWGVLDTKDSHDIYKLNGDKWEKALGVDGKPAQGLRKLVVNDDATMLALDSDGKVFMRTDDSKKKVEKIESTRAEVVSKSQTRMDTLKQKIAKIKAKPRAERTPKERRQLKQSRAEMRELKGISEGHKAISRKKKRHKKGNLAHESLRKKSKQQKIKNTNEKSVHTKESAHHESLAKDKVNKGLSSEKTKKIANSSKIKKHDALVETRNHSNKINKHNDSDEDKKNVNDDYKKSAKKAVNTGSSKKKTSKAKLKEVDDVDASIKHERKKPVNEHQDQEEQDKKGNKKSRLAHGSSKVNDDEEDSGDKVSKDSKKGTSQALKKIKKAVRTNNKDSDSDEKPRKKTGKKKHKKDQGSGKDDDDDMDKVHAKQAKRKRSLSSNSRSGGTIIQRGVGRVNIKAIEKSLYGKKRKNKKNSDE